MPNILTSFSSKNPEEAELEDILNSVVSIVFSFQIPELS